MTRILAVLTFAVGIALLSESAFSSTGLASLGQSQLLNKGFAADPTELFFATGDAKFEGITLVARDSMVYVSVLITFSDGSYYLDRGLHLKQNGAHFFAFPGVKEISQIAVSGTTSELIGKNGYVEIYGGRSGAGSFDGFDDFHPR